MGKTIAPLPRNPPYRKHPHARGEDRPPAKSLTWPKETPPRTWGRLPASRYWTFEKGNTPTHVGKTNASWRLAFSDEKHPHARGEDTHKDLMKAWKKETPPRTWGRPKLGAFFLVSKGNTPTHVGKTFRQIDLSLRLEKHPHARGEDFVRVPSRCFVTETPPRTWGRLKSAAYSAVKDGNTPTHVGKTFLPQGEVKVGKKHPHARGEDKTKISARGRRAETPPRTWGRPAASHALITGRGNTPTHVGKTMCLNHTKLRTQETPPRTWGRLPW